MKEYTFNPKRRDFIKKSTLAMATVPLLNFAIKPNSTVNNQICIFSKHLHWLNFKEVGEFVKHLGYDGVDLTVRKGGHVPPEK
ncbi:MAG: sugar phosphate isomerase/epimerase, partial [Cyclobacteriaceae bacterium]|nr:sugar phosphate isomerase/epimerase [Cyclobacteriaceae bacterium]